MNHELQCQYISHSTRYPATIATTKTFTANANTSFLLNIEPSIINSGMLAPAPPMMRRELFNLIFHTHSLKNGCKYHGAEKRDNNIDHSDFESKE